MSLEHRVIAPAARAAWPPLLVLLHGLGSDEEDLLALAPGLDPRLLVVSARAPHRRGPGGFAWYHVDGSRDPPGTDPAEVRQSRDLVIDLVAQVTAGHGADPDRVFLLGFSQGAVVALAVALARPDLVRGVVAHSGRLWPEALADASSPALERLEVLLLHGERDEVIPVARGREARDALTRFLGPRLTYREWPELGHAISEESFSEARRWLAPRLAEPPSP